jgi:hypothetical protein
MDAIKEIPLKNKKILQIFQDDSPESPRDWDNLGIMYCSHKRYTLGDRVNPHSLSTDSFESWAEMEDHIRITLDSPICLPLYMYDHSGQTIATTPFNCKWDSGQIGYIYVTREILEKEYGTVDDDVIKKATKYLEGEVKTYNQYMTGDVYGFKVIEKIECDTLPVIQKEHDSCWGFYGDDFKTNGMLDHINSEDVPENIDKL